jgi:antitoxin ParD1/3/4
MSITLTPQAEELIRQKVAEGHYGSDGEVVEAALRLLEARDQRVNRIRESVVEGLAAIERGEGIEVTEAWMEERLRWSDERARRGDSPNPDVCP